MATNASNAPRGISDEELQLRFAYHPPRSEEDRSLHEDVRVEFLAVAQSLNELLPNGRSKSLCFTALEEAMFHANAAIARERGALEAARPPEERF